MPELEAGGESSSATYTLHGEPGHCAMTGHELSFDPPDRAGLMLNRTRAALAAHPAVIETERADIAAALHEMDEGLPFIRQHGDEAMRNAALKVADAALLIGLHHGGGPEFSRRLRRERTAAARRARRIDPVRDVIDRHAEAHLNGNPEDVGNAERIALAITDLVALDVQKIPGVRPAWRVPAFPLEGKQRERCTDRIRKQLKGCPFWTTVVRP